MANETLYQFTFRPLGSSTPVQIRLRKMLKYALRCLGLRCVDMKEICPEPRQLVLLGFEELEPR